MGGVIETNMNIATHCLVSLDTKRIEKKLIKPALRFNYIFHCFFYLVKMDENDKLYRI
jgi:hypothetical protein